MLKQVFLSDRLVSGNKLQLSYQNSLSYHRANCCVWLNKNRLWYCLLSLFLLARDSMLGPLYAIARPSVRSSHGWISRKRLKLRSCDFHHTVAPSLKFLQDKFHPEIRTAAPERGRQTRVGNLTSGLRVKPIRDTT